MATKVDVGGGRWMSLYLVAEALQGPVDLHRTPSESTQQSHFPSTAQMCVSTSISGRSARESRSGRRSTMPNTGSMLWREVGEEEACGAVEVEVEICYTIRKWLKLYYLNAASGRAENIPASTRTFSEILSDLQRSKISIKDWSLSDLTIGLYLIYLSQASSKNEAFKGVQISSNKMVQELIYHLELARGCYKGNATGLARYSMLRKRNVVKFVKDSSILRPGYYIGIDPRAKLVILGIRGTHTVYDLVTDLIALSDKKVSPKGFSTHFGTYEAARWYLRHELGIIRKCLEKHKDYKLRLVGHSLGGASAALLAIMLRKKSKEELGFSPDIISAVGFGTPPCISKEAAESCASYVSTVVLQDDIIPRLSAASLARLRNEILKADWVGVLEKEDLKHIVDIVTNAKLVVSSIQDVARKLGDYAKIVPVSTNSGVTKDPANSTEMLSSNSRNDVFVPEDLFLPGTLYYLQRDIEDINGVEDESYTLWEGDPGENFQRILLSGNLISDHRCESIYYALRDVLKTLPPPQAQDE
ncbi:unnamed protein product [Miscanthus lutarioriparius]|uniref:Fungal lipase-type domain-containing protein n=1 Tax=Miscanthus lutarioriparius TaxID=422564 RepID=A0A811N9A7_9POAL|nr:unnamed protein product [Miscanthus lutarioriparius]